MQLRELVGEVERRDEDDDGRGRGREDRSDGDRPREPVEERSLAARIRDPPALG